MKSKQAHITEMENHTYYIVQEKATAGELTSSNTQRNKLILGQTKAESKNKHWLFPAEND